jgi:hypothetical protein
MSTPSHEGSPLHERLLAAVGDRTYRAIASETGHNPETARRYMQGHAPSADFLSRICEVYDINAHWLMTGVGPMRQSESTVHVLRDASPSELLSAVADTLEKLLERVDRLEVFVQTLEARLRVHTDDDSPAPDASFTTGIDTSDQQAADNQPQDDARRARAKRVAGTAAQRPPSDAR